MNIDAAVTETVPLRTPPEGNPETFVLGRWHWFDPGAGYEGRWAFLILGGYESRDKAVKFAKPGDRIIRIPEMPEIPDIDNSFR